jgi:hypothetical protein
MSRAFGLSAVGERREESHSWRPCPRSHSAWLKAIPPDQESCAWRVSCRRCDKKRAFLSEAGA